MKPRPAKQTSLRQTFDPTPKAAAAGSGGRGSGRGGGGDKEPPRKASSPATPERPGLTAIFNRAAKRNQGPPPSTFKQQIEEIEKMMSRPKPDLTLKPRYADSNKPRPTKDDALAKQLRTILETVAKHREKLRDSFTKSVNQGRAMSAFNKASRKR